eukprot:9076233-Pyramimonas_sp.AAC.1
MELTGPMQAPVVYNWSWEVGASADLNLMVKEWFEFSERRLIQIHGVDPLCSKAFVGRAAGPKSKVVSLASVWERDQKRRFSRSTTAWISYVALCRRACQTRVGKAGRQGRMLLDQ